MKTWMKPVTEKKEKCEKCENLDYMFTIPNLTESHLASCLPHSPNSTIFECRKCGHKIICSQIRTTMQSYESQSQSNWTRHIELNLWYIPGVLDVKINTDPENKSHLIIEIYTHDEKLLGIVKNCEIEDAIDKTIPAGMIYSIRKIKKEGE